jgi:hypothetical protein
MRPLRLDTLRIKASGSSETLVTYYQTIPRHIPEDSNVPLVSVSCPLSLPLCNGYICKNFILNSSYISKKHMKLVCIISIFCFQRYWQIFINFYNLKCSRQWLWRIQVVILLSSKIRMDISPPSSEPYSLTLKMEVAYLSETSVSLS